MPKLFRDSVCLWANSENLEQALSFARDFRCCSRTVWLGPNFFLVNGPSGVRCFHEMGITDIILDLRLIGSPREIWQCVSGVGSLNIKGISLSAAAGRANLKNAINAAEAVKTKTGKLQRPRILLSPLPAHIDDAELIDELGMRVRRKEHLQKVAELALATGADGVIVEYEDMHVIRRVSRTLPQLVFAQKRANNPMEIEAPEVRDLASVSEILQTKAAHVIYDSQLVRNTDAEWAADMLNKELELVPVKPKKSAHNAPQDSA